MNKLLVSSNLDIFDGCYILSNDNDFIDLDIHGNVKLYLNNLIFKKLNINIEDNSNLIIYKFNNDSNDNEIYIKQNNDSKLELNISFINNKESKLVINSDIIGNNNKSVISLRNISNNDNSYNIINVKIKKNTQNNEALEDLKGITNNGYIHIEPNIECESHEVIANHLTTIGSLNKDDINYLMSKGINEDKAKELLLNSFLYSNMDDYFKNREVNDE